MSLQPGSQLGSYEIIALVGAGGMGEVWRARDPRLGREIAIKVLPADVASRPERLARFEREARAVAALNHPNVVTLHSIEESGGVRFLTLELVEGAGFETLVEPAGLPVSRVLALLLPVAEALAAAHARGIVHRDLKPANVMLTRDGRVKVLDFGLARHDDDSGAIDVTTAPTVAVPASSAGLVVGTVPYMSPEQLRGERVDARSDLFSFGVLAYELATGRRPFGGTSTAEITSSILRDAPPPVRGTRADLPAAFERLVARCLEKDPERRIQTAKDVRNELELLQRDASSPAMPAAAPAAGPAPSLAVLPFENRSRDADDEYFADGLADELLGVLGKIRGLRVAARTSSRQFRDSAEPASAIGTKLGVAMLLEGSVRKSGNRVRIAVQLVEAASGFHAWSETYDRTLDDIFAVQDDIARAVVQEVRVHLLGQETDSKASGEVKAEVAAAAAGRGTDAEAHRLYLQGRFLVDRLGEADITTGIQILTRAVEIDPSHARAWAALSWAYTLSAATGREAVEIGMPRAQEAALHAIALAPELPEPHVALGRVHQWYTFDWKAAVDCCGRALALAPDDPDVLRANATIAYNLCDFDRARDLVRRSLELDPIAVTGLAYMGRILISRGDYAEAEAVLRRAIDLAPGATSSHAILSHVLMELGRHDEALATAQAEPMEWARLYSLGMIYHRMGRRADSDEALARLVAGWASKALFQIASIHAVRGEADAAFEWLERAYAERDSGVGITKASPHLRSLHSDPRWRPFLRKIGLED